MDRRQAELDDKEGKMQRYIQKTEEGTTLSAILNDMADSAEDPKQTSSRHMPCMFDC